ncbi:C40 family peptidase [Marinisporobacter balticus]|uniref:SH3 domain-containing protein n=1 Tax=Marinisporobacter balticus TaxID=2018667 RepID=A0A4R2KU27_9FIRM|nr:C40 family peptidase [Marinisporobacter balticus]TCO77374.1 SH3 domain-containing protein [Marinisporobacter balticus]
MLKVIICVFITLGILSLACGEETIKGAIIRKEKDSIRKASINANTLNVREQPSTTANVIQNLENGTEVTIVEENSEWYCIMLNYNNKGWVHRNYVVNTLENNTDVNQSDDEITHITEIVDFAKKYLGVPYKLSANGPDSFDCSGFTSYVYENFGIKLPRRSSDQGKVGKKISKNNLRKGDLVFFDTKGKNNGKISHAGIYIEDGEFIHASSGKKTRKVIISNLNKGYFNDKYVTARRIF